MTNKRKKVWSSSFELLLLSETLNFLGNSEDTSLKKSRGASKIVYKYLKCLIDLFCIYIIVKIFSDNWKIMAPFPSPEFAWHGIIKCHLASGVSLVIKRQFLSVSHTPLPPRSPVYTFKDLAWRYIWMTLHLKSLLSWKIQNAFLEIKMYFMNIGVYQDDSLHVSHMSELHQWSVSLAWYFRSSLFLRCTWSDE